MNCALMNRFVLAHVAACVCVNSFSATAPAQATITGFVRDSAGQAIEGAEVSIRALGRVTRVDESGRYLLENIAPGMRLLSVRRVGYSPLSRMVAIVAGENRQPDMILERVVVTLDTVVTRDRERLRDPLLREFEENRKLGLGHFITREELKKQEGRKMSTIVRELPGLALVGNPLRNEVYVKSNRSGCYAQIYVDYALQSRWERVSIDMFIPEQIESIEWYAGPAQTPSRYSGLGSPCGVLVLHTRRHR